MKKHPVIIAIDQWGYMHLLKELLDMPPIYDAFDDFSEYELTAGMYRTYVWRDENRHVCYSAPELITAATLEEETE